jgi:hypothetical protein
VTPGALPELADMLPFLAARVAEDVARAHTPRDHAEAHAKEELLGEVTPADPFVRSSYDDGRGDLAWAVVVALARIYVDHPGYRPEWNYVPPVMRGTA